MSRRGPFKPFKADARVYKPRRESKQAFVERVHGDVVAGQSIQDLWLVYYRERFAKRIEENGGRPLEPEHVEMLREVFYAGVTTMFHLMNVMAGPNEEDDDIGAGRLQRLYEELETYAMGRR